MMLRLCRLLSIGILVLGGTAQGHSLWVTSQGRTVRVVFEHSPNPGKGTYNAEILANGKTWVRTADHTDLTRVVLREAGQPGSLFLEGSTEVVACPRIIEHSCLFGVYRGRLDYFYGKFLDVADPAQLKSLARSPKLPLDIVPMLTGKKLELRVLWQGELLTEYRFGMVTPDGEESSPAVNDQGTVTIEPTQTGIYGFWVIRMDDEPKSVHEGTDYSGTMHATTLSLHWPLACQTTTAE